MRNVTKLHAVSGNGDTTSASGNPDSGEVRTREDVKTAYFRGLKEGAIAENRRIVKRLLDAQYSEDLDDIYLDDADWATLIGIVKGEND